MSDDVIQIQWTSETMEEARRVARLIIQAKLAACVQIIPWIESVFWWEEAVKTAQETKVLIKTKRGLLDQIRTLIEENASYEVPEITFIALTGGNEKYLSWLENALNR